MCMEGSPDAVLLSAPRDQPFERTIAALFPPLATSSAYAHETAPGRRSKLWEIPAAYHCAIVGTCLPLGELRRLARRAGIEEADSASDYELHHAAVNLARERNTLSELVHKALETRYVTEVRQYSQCRTAQEIQAQWRDSLVRGAVAGAVWALMSHARAVEELRDLVSQDVHMLSHQCGASSRADLRRLRELERETTELRELAERQRKIFDAKLQDRTRAVNALEQRAAAAADIEIKLRATEARFSEVENGSATSQAGCRTPHVQRAAELARRSRESAQRDARCRDLERELEETRRERDAAKDELRVLCAELSRPDVCPRECGDLAGRRVLCVGGRTGSVEQYRALVERWSGGFVHHDGGLEHNARRLHSLLGSADAVICETTHVSHGAYYVVKRFCKQHGKPCVLLKNSGLASFLSGLEAIAAQ